MPSWNAIPWASIQPPWSPWEALGKPLINGKFMPVKKAAGTPQKCRAG